MNKWLLFFCILNFYSPIYAQKEDSSASKVKTAAKELLEKKITFSCPAASLENVIQLLSKEKNIKFSYSNNKLENIPISANYFNNVSLELVLNRLFKYTGLHYLVVGRIIVILKDVGKVDSTKVVTDSVRKINNPHKKQPFYLEDPFFMAQPESVKRKIRKLYQNELLMAAKQQELLKNTINDTIDKDYNSKPVSRIIIFNKSFFTTLNLGYSFYYKPFINTLMSGWMEETNYSFSIKNSPYFEGLFGTKVKHFLFSMGVGLQYYSFKEDGNMQIRHQLVTEKEKDNNRDGGKHTPSEPIYKITNHPYSSSLKGNIISIPFNIEYEFNRKKFAFNIGPSFILNIIKVSGETTAALKNYYTLKEQGEFKSLKIRSSASFRLKSEAHYILQSNITFGIGVSYTYFSNPIIDNSLYELNTDNITAFASFRYFFGTKEKKGLSPLESY